MAVLSHSAVFVASVYKPSARIGQALTRCACCDIDLTKHRADQRDQARCGLDVSFGAPRFSHPAPAHHAMGVHRAIRVGAVCVRSGVPCGVCACFVPDVPC